MLDRILFLIPIWLLLDIFYFRILKNAVAGYSSRTKRLIYFFYWAYDLLLIGAVLNLKISGLGVFSSYFFTLVGPILISFLPKVLMFPVAIVVFISKFIAEKFVFKNNSEREINQKFVSQVLLITLLIPMGYVAFGVGKGAYHYQVHEHTLYYEDLPASFDGFKITQISDIHMGSLENREAVIEGVELANAQNSDIIVFTGDLVNDEASEIVPWVDVFSELSAPLGVYSILGNHDYGMYKDWRNEAEMLENIEKIKNLQKSMGFQLLIDEHKKFERNGEHLYLAGVQNWGRGRRRHADLDKAVENIEKNGFTVLLSHDPNHWEGEILQHKHPIHLTLSGHTHGMQVGIEDIGIRWSPAKYMYNQWAGIYEKEGKYINVNRGFGFLGFKGRIGVYPEITVITLKKK